MRSLTLLSQSLQPEVWSDWFATQGAEIGPEQPMLSFSLFSMVVEAAVGKLGVALVPELSIEKELMDGQLVLPFKDAAVHTMSLYLAYPVAKSGYPPLQIFRKWLLDQCQKDTHTPSRPAPALEAVPEVQFRGATAAPDRRASAH